MRTVWRASGEPLASVAMPEGRHRASPRGLLIGAGVALLAIIGVAFVVLRGGGTAPLGLSTPSFTFEVQKAIATSLEDGVKDPDLMDRAAATATEVQPVLSAFFTEAFLNPGNWQKADYADVWGAFTEEARPEAIASLQVLTLGDLGLLFDDVQPKYGVMSVRVLYGADGEPSLINVSCTFRATATPSDGTTPAEIVSKGDFMFERSGDSWAIFAFRVDRSDIDLPQVEVTP